MHKKKYYTPNAIKIARLSTFPPFLQIFPHLLLRSLQKPNSFTKTGLLSDTNII